MWLLEKIKNWYRKQFWWRSEYRKIKTRYRGLDRCNSCCATGRGGFPGQRFCNDTNHLCPCKKNEMLIFK